MSADRAISQKQTLVCHDRLSVAIRVLVTILFVQSIFFAIEQRHLYADGAWFFLGSILTGEVGFEPRRYAAQALTQIPHMMLYRFGVRDFEFLSTIYGAMLFLQLPVSIVAIRYILRPEEILYLCLTFVLVASALFNHLFVISESLTYLCATSVVVAYVLTKGKMGRWARPIVAVAAAILIAAYETAAISNAFLILALAQMRWREGRSDFDKGLMLVLLAGILYQLLSALGGMNSNLGHFLRSLSYLDWPLILALVVIAISWPFFSNKLLLLSLTLTCMTALILSTLVRERPTLDFETWVVRTCYALRVANVAAALAVSILAAFSAPMRELRAKFPAWNWKISLLPFVARSTAVMLSVFITFQTYLTLEWDLYLDALTSFVVANEGIVEHHFCPPCARPGELGLINFGWGWTYPTLTLLLGTFSETGGAAVVLNREIGWEPFSVAEIPRIRTVLGI